MLLTVKIPTPAIEDELRLIRQELAAREPGPYSPVIFLRLAVEVIRMVRDNCGAEVNPCAALDAALLSRNIAFEAGRTIVSHQDIRAGVNAALCGAIAGPDREVLLARIDRGYPDVAEYIQRHIPGVALAGLAQQLRGQLCAGACCTAGRIRQSITGGAVPDELAVFAGWLIRHESLCNYRLHEVMAVYLAPYYEVNAQKQLTEEPPV